MAMGLVEREPREYEFVITPTGNELPEMIEHWRRLGALLGKPLRVISTHSLGGLIRHYNALPNWRMRWCTRQIKIEPFQAYALSKAPAICYVGIRADEAEDREGTDHSKIEGVSQDFPLVRWGWDKAKVLSYLAEKGIEIPARTDCAACFFQTLGEWWRLWKDHPEQYAEAEGWEESVGHTLRSPQRDSWPAALKDLRSEFESGRVPRGADQQGRSTGEERQVMCSWCAR